MLPAYDGLLQVNRSGMLRNTVNCSLKTRISTPKFTDFLAMLSDKLEFEGPAVRPWGATHVYLLDPNDIQVVVYEGCP